jgi:hypothetical protein
MLPHSLLNSRLCVTNGHKKTVLQVYNTVSRLIRNQQKQKSLDQSKNKNQNK